MEDLSPPQSILEMYWKREVKKLFTDKTVKQMNTTGLVAYTVHVFIFKLTSSYRQWIIQNGFTKEIFITVYFMDSEEDLLMVEDLLNNENVNIVPIQETSD